MCILLVVLTYVYNDARYRKRQVYSSVERNPFLVRSPLTAQWWRYRALRFFLSKSLIGRAARGQYWNTCQSELLSSDVEVTSWWCPLSKHCRIWLSGDVTGDVDKILILEFITTWNVKVTVFWNMTSWIFVYRSICHNPHSVSNWYPRITRQPGYKHTFCPDVVSTKLTLLSIFP